MLVFFSILSTHILAWLTTLLVTLVVLWVGFRPLSLVSRSG